MADVRPFAGVTYDPARVDLARVLCAPYDVISPAQQQAYLDRDPRNAVRIVLNPAPGEQRYPDAARELRSWLADGILRRSGGTALYVHRHGFESPAGGTLSRTGLIAAVRLGPWATGAVRPHEHTMPGAQEDPLGPVRGAPTGTEAVWGLPPRPARQERRRRG